MTYLLERVPRKVPREGGPPPEPIVVTASDDAVRGMLDSGMFVLLDGQELSGPCDQGEPEEAEAPEAEADISEGFGAFAEDAIPADLAGLTNDRLGEILRSLGGTVPKRTTKAELIALIEEARG